uniref:Desmoglein 2 n=1 Tax=Gadus morhua TaxID=8049 RepID=A0A8C5CKR3_GADMO
MPLYLSHSLYISSVCLQFVLVAAGDGEKMLKRQKREWIIAPRKLNENYDYTHQAYIAKIRSDKEYDSRVIYTLMGKGADQNPFGRFSVNPDTGLVKVHSILDREEISNYTLLGVAKYSNGAKAEKDIELAIVVLDENDCSPVFQVNQMGSVNESSPAGTIVMRVTATDADEGINSVISYSIVDASSSMFIINSRTGEVMVRQNTLDRETKDTYTLTVRGTDLNGMAGGRSSTGDVVIKLLDINDNIPTLEKEMYVGHVEENTVNVEVMRVRAIDLDMMYTDNWLSVFSFASGNEAGYFSITTDSKTNEGVIMIQKSLDYEELKVVNLALSVSNKAEYSFRHEVTHKTYPIKINVVNQKEGPRFHPNVKVVTLSEDSSTISINKVITNYAAIDSDTTKIATNVWYAKLEDVGGWLTIDEHTADIKLNKLPDRESKYLKNGTYYAKIICITKDTPIKTATGTIAIQVEDYNDHCPELTVTSQTMCVNDNMVYVTAVDKDEFPNSAPFEFRVISESKQKWTIEPFNKTTVILRDQAHLWPGYYKVTLEVTDQQGKSCAAAQVLDVLVCTCREDTESCVARETSTAKFGASGVLLLLLGLLLLLLLPLLLLFCLCGGAGAIGSFKAIPFDAKEQLIAYHTEGLGEAKVPDINPNKIPQVNMFSHVNVREKDHVSVNTHNVQNTLNAQNTLNTHNTSSVVSGSSSMVQGNLVQGGTQGIATLPRMQYQDNMVMAGQTMLVQQPTMYYTAAPMYVVEQRPQMVLVTGGAQPAVGQVGLGQGLMQVGGSQQGVVLVETQMAAGTQPHYVANGTGLAVSQGAEQTVITTTTEHVTKAQGVSHGGSAGGSMSRQQVVMLDNGSASAGASGSRGSVQTVLLEGQGLAGPGLEVRDQGLAGFSVRYQQGSSAGSYKSSAVKTTPIAVGSQNVVTQHKKIVVTERNVETSSQA